MPSFSSDLEATLHRALEAARERRHEYSTLEHLLLALVDDESAAKAMSACGVDLDALRTTVVTYLDTELQALSIPADRPILSDREERRLKKLRETPDEIDAEKAQQLLKERARSEKEGSPIRLALEWEIYARFGPQPTSGFQRVVQRAILHVQSSGQEEVNGGRVLVALFSERESYAVYFLQQQDMSRLDAVSYLSHGVGKSITRDARPEVKPPEPARPSDSVLDKFSGYRSVQFDMKPHVDAISLQPALATPRIAEKIVDFISELALLRQPGSDCALTVGVYGQWGSGKSTLLSKVSEIFRKDGAVVVSINAWKWDGEKNVHHFITEQLLSSLSTSKAFKWKARLIKCVLYVRQHPRKSFLVFCAAVVAAVTYFLVDWASWSPGDLFGKKSLLALISAGTLGALAKPVAVFMEKVLIRPKIAPEPGVKLSQAFRYLMWAKQMGDTAGKHIVFVFDDLDRCDPDRVMRFIGSIQNLTLAGAINIIGCDDRIISSAIYKQFKDIADLSGEGRDFGTRFLEKIVQVHFRMPDLAESDLVPLGLKSDIAGSAAGVSGEKRIATENVIGVPEVAAIESEPAPVKDLVGNSEKAPDEMALSFVCGEVLGAILEIYRLPIRKVKFLSNVMKLHMMIFPPPDVHSALRNAAFIAMINVDETWLRGIYWQAGNQDIAEDDPYKKIHKYLSPDKEQLSSLYRLCGINVGRTCVQVTPVQAAPPT